MKKEKEMYAKLVEILKNNPPVVDHPQQLTESVMRRISQLPQKQHKKKTAGIFWVTGWLSGIAATLLLCFFVKETLSVPPSFPAIPENTKEAFSVERSRQQPVARKDMTFSEKNEFVQYMAREIRASRQKQERRQANLTLMRISE